MKSPTMRYIVRRLLEQEAYLGLAMVRETDRIEAMKFYKEKAGQLRVYGIERAGITLGLVPSEGEVTQ